MPFSSVVHDSDTQTLTITIRADKIVTLVYQNLPAPWLADPVAYEQDVLNLVNTLIEERTPARDWYRDRDIKSNDPEYMNMENTERQWLEPNAGQFGEVVFMECIVTNVTWSVIRNQYIFELRVTTDTPKVVP